MSNTYDEDCYRKYQDYYEQGLEGEYKGDELKEVNQSGTRMVY